MQNEYAGEATSSSDGAGERRFFVKGKPGNQEFRPPRIVVGQVADLAVAEDAQPFGRFF
jgi:hypothetical protein